MNAQELIQKSALIEKVIEKQGLQEKAGPFISENAVIKTEELEKTLKGMQDENRELKVGIIGRVKAGKSSLLNALIFEGKEVLPKAATPMTASLTILKYAQSLSAEAQFYDEKDIEELKRDHERYEKKFKEIVSEEVKKQKEKQSLSNRAKEGIKNVGKMFSRNKSTEAAPKERVLSDEEIVKRAERIAKSELEKDTKLVSSHDQYERMKKSGLLNTKDLKTRIQADSLEELNQKLYQFVGKEGKFMPYTKAVQISLNNPNLKDLEIIDTPGVNDPIVSREARTKALLKECDVVFVISPSNQFLTDSDMDLFDRVSNKEGIQEIYFVASQTDSAVCAPSEVENSRHYLPTALENAQKILSSSLNATMSLLKKKYPHQQEIFESAKKNGVILTSGICFSMYKDFKNQASWEREKEEYQLAWENLTNDYPDAFSSNDKSKESLLLLSNVGAIKERLEEAAKEKENIISQRLQKYLKSQANNLSLLVANLLEELESEKDRIKNTDLKKISEQLKEYEKLASEIKDKSHEAYREYTGELLESIRKSLSSDLEKFIKVAKNSATREKEEKTEYYTERVKQDGFLGDVKGFFGDLFGEKSWGYDEVERSREITIVKAGAVVDYLEEMNRECQEILNKSVRTFESDFRKGIYQKVFPVLRGIIHDDSLIDERELKKSVDAVTDKIKFKKFDYADKLPKKVANATGMLKDDDAIEFMSAAERYVRDFTRQAHDDADTYVDGLRKNLLGQNFGSNLISKLVESAKDLKKQAENQQESLAQIEKQIKALKEI
ncbi:dynamin-like GTPase family protein [Helicobacter pylori]|uniref:dynamin family protein n=1 Tax=Helicobacter pylori TaxID=210 RepID=UPI001921665B|nr:dynamin family protein [Helicobacter pylori]QQW85242.1 dynamin-like GTPase family protein [Helicobacter pylori]